MGDHRTASFFLTVLLFLQANVSTATTELVQGWHVPQSFRVLLRVDPRDQKRSNSPASVSMDFEKWFSSNRRTTTVAENSLVVFALDPVAPSERAKPARRVPHHVERLFGSSRVTLRFSMPDEHHTNYLVYFEVATDSNHQPAGYSGLVGHGDFFRQDVSRRGVAASHFDCFVDFDRDNDLDLFQGGVEPFVYCFENTGQNRLVARGRLSSGGDVFKLASSRANRSWVTVAFYDFDRDGDHDFFPSFGDGPDAGKIIYYHNTARENDGQLTFKRIGPLQTVSDTPLAGGTTAGGWFPSIDFVADWDQDGVGPDALVGSANRCWVYRSSGSPRFHEPAALRVAGTELDLVNPRFSCADADNDGDLDLFAGTQPGAVYFFKNTGTRSKPEFSAGKIVAWAGKYLIGDAHSGVTLADFNEDGLLDIVSGRFWERANLDEMDAARRYGGFFKNVGVTSMPTWEYDSRGGPYTEEFQICDAVRQNCVRAVDWDVDGKLDLLAGDTDGFIWFFRNTSGGSFSLFERGERLRAQGEPLNLTAYGGHARFDVCDWNQDGRKDLVVADGHGSVSLFLNRGASVEGSFARAEKITAQGKPIQVGARASVLVCDWNNDRRQDLILADDRGYYFCENIGKDSAPAFTAPAPITFGGLPAKYVRPNLGSFVDWDGDGKRDFIACHFENSIRLYRNIGSGAPGTHPQFEANPEGVVLLEGESPQMISGAHAIDWNGDGDIDLLTGQGHGGSGLRFYERDWIEDQIRKTPPLVNIVGFERRN